MIRALVGFIYLVFLIQPASAVTLCGQGDSFPDIVCPTKKDNGRIIESTLYKIDFTRGIYQCRYANGTVDNTPEMKISCSKTLETYANISTDSQRQDYFNKKFDTSIKKFSAEVYPDESTSDKKAPNHFIGSTNFDDFLKTYPLYEDLDNFRKNAKITDFNYIDIDGKIDSHTHAETTLGSIITGVFTLDPEYFINGYINGLGELELNEDLKKMTLTQASTVRDMGDGGVLDWFKSWFNWEDKAGEVDTFDALSFMDRQILGFLVYLGIAFKQAYMDIIYLVLGLGVFWSFGFYTYKKTMALADKKDSFNVNKTSWLMGASMAIAFFVAPIVNDGEIPVQLKNNIYESGIRSDADTSTNWSTPAQETLRMFLQTGTYFGNLTSDYGMFAFLKLIAYKEGIISNQKNVAESGIENLEKINRLKLKLLADMNFYSNVCRKYYNVESGSMLKNKSYSSNVTMMTDDKEGVLKNAGVMAQRLNYDACTSLEISIQKNTNKLVTSLQTETKNLKNIKSLINKDPQAAQDFQRYVNTVIYTQNIFGWINAPMVPISYFFFKNRGFFAYNTNETINKEDNAEAFKKIAVNYVSNEYGKSTTQKVLNSASNAMSGMISSSISLSYWMMMPGFKDIFEVIRKNLTSIYVSRVDTYNAIVDKKTKQGFLSKVMDKLSVYPLKIVGKFGILGKIAGSIAGWMMDDSKSKLVVAAITVFSFLLAIYFIQIAINAISVTIIAVFLSIKITLFLVEILLFYFISPAIGIFYAMMNNSQSKNFVGTYFQNIGILAMTPTLLTMTTFLIIVVAEFLESFFLALINLFSTMMGIGADELAAAADRPWYSGLDKALTMGMIEGIASIFVYFAVIIVATIMIFNFRDWYTKLLGIDNAMNIMKEGGNEMKQGVSKYVNPVG